MKQNIYDNHIFYNSYIDLREKGKGLNDVLEIPAFRSLLPDLNRAEILDLGCGFGESCNWYVSSGAKRVVGIDISKKMIDRAEQLYKDVRIEYLNIPIEDLAFDKNSFDLVLSSLAFHYVADFKALIKKTHECLKLGGFLIFSQEHPIVTAKKLPEGWEQDKKGKKLHWIVDDYSEEGIRKQKWFVEGVIKYHRTMASVINSLIDTGFGIVKILEPTATSEAESLSGELKNERRRPPFLMVKVQKQKD